MNGNEDFNQKLGEILTVESLPGRDGDFLKKLVAKIPFQPEDTIISFKEVAVFTDQVRYSSVQVGPDRHIELNCNLIYLNHSCDPNVKLNIDKMEVVAIKPIQIGDELTFFYPSTEWDMAQPFDCWCGSSRCLKKVQGAKYLQPSQLNSYYFSDHITKLLKEQTKIQ